MDIKCPKCQTGNIIEKEKLFSCSEQKYNSESKENEGCDFILWKNIFGTTLDFEEVREIIEGKEIKKKCVSKAGKPYDGLLSFDMEEFRIKLNFPDKQEEETDENGIIEFSKGYKKDNKIVWKQVSGKEITYEEAVALFNGGTIRKENMKSQAGNEFSANLALNEEGKIEMSFDN